MPMLDRWRIIIITIITIIINIVINVIILIPILIHIVNNITNIVIDAFIITINTTNTQQDLDAGTRYLATATQTSYMQLLAT